MKTMNNADRNQYKNALRLACERYMIAYDRGDNPYREFSTIKNIVRRLDGNWKKTNAIV